MSMSEDEQIRFLHTLSALYARYATALDDGPLSDWPTMFTEECMYQIIPRDNFDAGLPVAIMRCESRAMLEDRVTAVEETMLYEPRYLRHHITNIFIEHAEGQNARVRANFSVIEILPDELPRISMTGRYLDQLERGSDCVWRFREKLCVFDSVLVPNSIVLPI
jgi:anthranilate 1,2-dioxygenase small subunit